MASRVLVSGLPRSLPPLPPGPAPTCVPCVEGRQRAAPHSSEFPPTEAPLQTLHMDVWGPARVRGQGHERYFLLVVDDYSRYTTVFPLRSKGDVTEVLIDWIRAARLQLRESFGSDFPVLRLHSDRGGEFSSARLGAFCRAQGIRQTFTLPASPQQNGIAEHHIGMVMDVAHTSMIHAAAPHFLWPFAVQYAAHQLNLQPRVSLPKTSPTLRWTEKVGDASAFRVWGSRAFVRDLSADKLSPRAIPCVFLGFPPDAPGWQFYHPTSRRVLSSQDVTFDESVPYYRLFPYRIAPLPPPTLFLGPGPPPVDPLPPQGPAPSGVSQVDAVEPVEVAVDSGASRGAEPVGSGSGGAESGGAESGGAESGGAEPGGAESGGAEPGGAEPGGAESGGAEPGGAEPGGAEPGGAASARVASRSASSRRELLSPQELREWFARRWSRAAGTGGLPVAPGPGGARTGGTGGVGTGGAAAAAGVGPAGASGAAGAGAAGGVGAGVGLAGGTAVAAGGTGAAVTSVAGVGAVGAGGAASTGAATGGTGAVPLGSGGPARPRPYFVPLLEQVLRLPPSPGPAPPLECPQPVQSQSPLQPVSPLPAPSPYAGPTGGLAERREPASRPASPVCTNRTSRRAPRPRPPAVPGTLQMALRPSTAPLRVPLPSPPESSLPVLADPVSDSLRAASHTVARLHSTVVTDPSFESTAASSLVSELVDFAARCRLDYATRLVAESESVCPPSVGGECALSTDVLEDRQKEFQCFAAALPHLVSTLIAPEGDSNAPDIPTPRSYAEAIEGPYSSQWQSAMDAEMASWKSTGTYVDEVPPPGANIVSGMWIFRVKRPPGSPLVFKARYVARGFSQRQGVDYFQTFSPTPKMTTLRVLLHVAAQRDYELHSLDFSTAFLQGSLHEEIWLRRPPGFTRSFPPGTQWSLRRPVYGLRQAHREWHDTLRTTLAALGFAPSTADPSLFLRTDTSLPPFYILVYVDDLVFATADTVGIAHVKSELQKRHTCTDLGELRSYLGLQITRDRAQRTITLTQSHMVQQVLQRFDFTYSSPQTTPLSTRHSLSALPLDESVEPSGPYPELIGCLMYLMTCTRPDLACPLSILARYVAPGRHRPEHMAAAKRVLRYLCSTLGLGLVLGGRRPVVLTGHANASWADDQATQRSSQGYTFSLGSGSVSWRSTRSSSVLGSSCEAEIYAGAMAAEELRWLTYLLTDLGEPPRSPPVLYIDNKAMLALCREHRLEHRTKHISLRYFLARELQQRGQLRLIYVASEANTADIFTKALPPGDHQRFCTMLALPRSLPPLPLGPAPTCVPCVEGRQRAAPHPSTFPPTEAPLQTLHMDVWGPAHVRGQGHERFFLLVVDDYSSYITFFPLGSKAEVPEGIRQTFTLPASPQQNGIAERRIGMVMEVTRTSMIHAAAPHFLWPFVVQYTAHQINLQPRISLPETTPTLRWTGKVGDASAFRVLGSRAFVCDTSADKLSSRAVPCVFLGFPRDAPGWQFYHPTSRRVLSSQDVTFDESVSYYRLFPYHTASLPPPPLFLAPGTPPPVELAVDSGAARGAEAAGAGTRGAEPGGAEPERVEPGGDESGGTASGGAEPTHAKSGGSLGIPLRQEPLSPQQLCEWYARSCRRATGAAGGAGGAGATGGAVGAGAAGGAAGAGATGGAAGSGAGGGGAGVGAAGGAAGAGAAGAAGPGGARTGGYGAAGAGGAAGVGAAGVGAAGTGAGGAAGVGAAGTGAGGAEGTGAVSALSGGAARPRPYYVPLLQQVLGLPPSLGPTLPLLSPPPVQSQLPLQPSSPLPGPSPYSGPTRGLTERREPESRRVSPVSRSALPRVPLPSPPTSSLPEGPDPESDSLRAASPTVTRFLATAVTDPLFESTAASALVAELVDFAAACRLDYATSLVAESASASLCPPSVRDPNAPDIPTPRSYTEAIEGPYSSQWQAAMDAKMASWKSTGTYVDEVPPRGANIVLLHVAAQRDYELHSLDFSTAFLQGSLHKEISLRRPPGFTGSFPAVTQWSLRRPVYGLHQAPREWHDTLRTTLATLGFAPSTAEPSLFLRTDTTLPPFYVLVYVDDLVFATADTEALAHVKSELQKRHTCTDLGELTSYLGLRITRDRA
ncbi:unnamed protein product [Closterium sp. NIES-54]